MFVPCKVALILQSIGFLVGLCCTHNYYKIAKASRITAEHGVVKANGSWVILDTPAQKIRVLPTPSLPPPRSFCWSVWWENLHAFKNIFLFVRTDLSHCMSLEAGQPFLFNAEKLVSIYMFIGNCQKEAIYLSLSSPVYSCHVDQ